MQNPTTLERAFSLARSGTCLGVSEIRQALKRERFDNVQAHLSGPSIGKQLRNLCQASRLQAPSESPHQLG
ncbi:MAG TPA: hypothetical protein VGD10_08335 [Allosphingosinicella sp.]|uniref:hypothetical protein n=1 Tax=Allosphingosinicella sp. TaxID=2823234 RepID=UPI002EDAD24B